MANVTNPETSSRGHGARLDGWKSIATYLRRDRTTVIRWARERNLPVHRLPGGRTGTVYALKAELDNWVGLPGDGFGPAPALPPAATGPAKPVAPDLSPLRSGGRRWMQGLVIAGLAIGIPGLIATRSATVAEPSLALAAAPVLPADPATSARFLEARDLVAGRKAPALQQAIVILKDVVRAAPNYPLGHATLAEALLLSREFGTLGDADAFAQARLAAHTAVRLEPDLAAGHRMLGFLAYWADKDFAEADAHFQRALKLDPGDALSHFWYGNILSDHGNHMAGLKALNQARLLQPGSIAIATDLAWAQWAAGQDAVAKSALDGIIREQPDFAVAYDCRAIIALSEKDYTGYALDFARFADLKQDARLIENARSLQNAMRQGPERGRMEIMRQALADVAEHRTDNHVWPALVASVGGDRAQLNLILLAADRRDEQWEAAGLRLRIERAWRQDPAMRAILARRNPRAELQT